MPYGTVNADVIQSSVANTSLGAGNASIMKNRIINGAMVIDQRNAGASVTQTTSTVYTLDRWNCYGTVASKFTVQQSSTAPAGFRNSALITSSSAYSIGSGDIFQFVQPIEGFNTADLMYGTSDAKTITLSFWVRSSLTGTFGGSLSNNDGSRSYIFSYSISAANTWEQKSITIVGDTTGTWNTTTGTGISVRYQLGTGSTYSNTAGSWYAGNVFSATGATSVVGTNGATFYITGVQLEVGSSATGYEYRQHGQELALCQRYYAKSYAIGTAPGTAYTAGISGVSLAVGSVAGMGTGFTLPVTLRTSPTLTIYDAAGTSARMTYYFAGWNNGGTILSSYADAQQGFAQANPTSTAISFQYTVSAEL